jgi:hypothetical protein
LQVSDVSIAGESAPTAFNFAVEAYIAAGASGILHNILVVSHVEKQG